MRRSCKHIAAIAKCCCPRGKCLCSRTVAVYRHWSELDSMCGSHGENNWPSTSSSAVWCQRRRVYIICCRTSV